MVVNAVVLTGMLVVIPLGLGLIDGPGLAVIRRWWLIAAVAGALSLWLPRGALAAAIAAPYALITVALAAQAPRRLAARRSLAPAEVAVLTALVTPAIAGTALVAERCGYRLFGFPLKILALTVAHFHYAGFAAALIAGLVSHSAGDRRAARAAALSVPAGTLIVLVGYFTGDWVELAGAAVLTAGMWLVGWTTWREVRTGTDRTTGVLLGASALVLVATMVLALDWALGEAAGAPHLSLTWMAATHGVGNAFGFALCGMLAWRRLRENGL
jgi:hypothetical protein